MTARIPRRAPASGRTLASREPMLEVEFLDQDGTVHRLDAVRARAVRFEHCLPMRAFTYRATQHHTPGSFWCAATSDLVGYESYLERQWLTALDFDPNVVALSSQPMTLHGADHRGSWRSTPDLFTRFADGTGLVTEVKNPDKLDDEDVQLTAERTAHACADLGLKYQFVGTLNPQRWANLRWLAGYRRPLVTGHALAQRILALTAQPVSIDDLLSFLHPPETAKPVIFHLLWHGHLECPMTEPLRGATLVRRVDQPHERHDADDLPDRSKRRPEPTTHITTAPTAETQQNPSTSTTTPETGTDARFLGASENPRGRDRARMTSFFRLAPTQWITFEDEAHQVIGLTETMVRLRAASGSRQLILTAELVSDPGFAPHHPDQAPSAAAETVDTAAQLDDLPAAERARVLEMEAHLNEAVCGFRSGDPDDPAPGEPRPEYDLALPLETRIQAKAREVGLTPRRLFQLLRQYREIGLWALVDKRKTRPSNPLAGVDPRIIAAIQQQAAYEVDDSTGTLSRFRRRVQSRLDAAHGPGTVTLPPKDTFRRHVALLTAGRYTFGPATTRRTNTFQPARVFGHVTAQRPGELVMLDTTRLDVMAYDPIHDVTLAVELTLCLDLFSRSMLSWCLTPKGTKGIEIGMLIADAMTPEPMRPAWKQKLRFAMDQTPYQRHVEFDERLALAAARPVIYPESIMIDHGKPYASEVMRRGCRKLGINILPSREGKPTDKPEVEAAFDTIREQFSQHVAGYKGRDVAHRGKDVEAKARFTIPEIEEFFAEYVVTVYQRKRHTGLTVPGYPGVYFSPNEAHAAGVQIAGFVSCPRDANQYYELLPIAWRKIRLSGVQNNYLTYDDADGDVLRPYRGRASHYKNPKYPKTAGLWPVRVDPRNLLHVYFYDELGDKQWHVLTWTHALSSHQPFTDHMLREIMKILAERGGNRGDQEEIAATLDALQNRTDAPESWTTTDRRRAATEALRAKAVARDKHRATATAPSDQPAFMLHAVPDPVEQPDQDLEDGAVDLSDLMAAPVWTPTLDKTGQ